MLLGIVALLLGNQRHQAEVNGRQAFINQSVRLSRLEQALVNTLAQAAVKKKDDAIRKLLSDNGTKISVTTLATAAVAAARTDKSAVL